MTKRESIIKKQAIQEQIIQLVNDGKIKIGDTFKSKAELCKFLNLDSRGSSLNTNLKIINTILQYEKISHTSNNQICITDIYSEPKEIIDGREEKSGNKIYSKLIETILMIYMSEHEQNVYYFTYPKIYQMLGMCNDQYHNYDLRKQLKNVDRRMTKYEVNTFFSESSSLMKKTLIRALNSMTNRSLIKYTKEIVIVEDDEDRNIKLFRTATEEEIQNILTVQRDTLKVLGIDDLYTAYMTIGYMKFMKKVNKTLKEKYGWEGYYEQLKIITASKFCLDGAIEYDFNKLKNTLNQNIQTLINNTNQTVVDKEKETLEQNWKAYKEGLTELNGLYANYEAYKDINQKRPDTFLQLQSILVKLFISLAPEEEKNIFKQMSKYLTIDGALADGDILEPLIMET